MKYRAVLYDSDGVVNQSYEYFSRTYARAHGLDAGQLETFFHGEFLLASVGKADLKELIVKYNDLWQWPHDPQELLNQWFEAENRPDSALLELIQRQRRAGLLACMATVQEQYRATYMQDVAFPGMFDAMFASCDLGHLKSEPEFFTKILAKLSELVPDIKPHNVVYFDDNQEGLQTATNLGIDAYLYEGIEQVKAVVGIS